MTAQTAALDCRTASKAVGRRLSISPRTVAVHRARLMRKTGAATSAELVNKLLSG